MNRVLKNLYSLLHELRLSNQSHKKLRNMPIYQHIMKHYRLNNMTSEQMCRGPRELQHIAETYRCYLSSLRQHQALIDEYSCSEKSTEEAAKIVGLNMPNIYNENNDKKE